MIASISWTLKMVTLPSLSKTSFKILNVIRFYFWHFIDKYFAFIDNIFYVASPKNIKIFTIVDEYENGAVERFSPNIETEVSTICPEDMKIHGLLVNINDDTSGPMLLVALETLDN